MHLPGFAYREGPVDIENHLAGGLRGLAPRRRGIIEVDALLIGDSGIVTHRPLVFPQSAHRPQLRAFERKSRLFLTGLHSQMVVARLCLELT